MEKVKSLLVNTWKDLKHCWEIYPNIIIHSCLVGFILGIVLV